MKIFFLNDKDRIAEVVKIHVETFGGFFLTFLGEGFLRHLYQGFVTHNNSELIVAQDMSGELVGFLAYSYDIADFYNYLIHKKLFQLGWYSLLAFVKSPKILFRIIRAFTYSSGAKRNDRYIELSSIGVIPGKLSMGVGSKMIDFLKANIDFQVYKYIKLETDANSNTKVNKFYKKNGFDLSVQYKTPEGRIMNEYHFQPNI